MFEKELNLYIENAKNRLKNENITREDEKNFLKNTVNGFCNCGKKLEITNIEMDKNNNNENGSCTYFFKCGHKAITCCMSEKMTISESLSGEGREKNKKKPFFEFLYRIVPSIDKKFIKGVEERRDIDRRNNKYNHDIIDLNTGENTHHEDELLSDHIVKKNIFYYPDYIKCPNCNKLNKIDSVVCVCGFDFKSIKKFIKKDYKFLIKNIELLNEKQLVAIVNLNSFSYLYEFIYSKDKVEYEAMFYILIKPYFSDEEILKKFLSSEYIKENEKIIFSKTKEYKIFKEFHEYLKKIDSKNIQKFLQDNFY